MFKKFVTYSISLYAATIFAAAIGVLIKSLIAKTIGKEALGIYFYFITVTTLGGAVLAFGLGRTLAKYVAEKRNGEGGEVVGSVLALQAVISVVLAAVGFLTWGHIELVYSLALIAVGPFTFFDLACAVLRGQLDRNREVPAVFLAALLRLMSVWLCVSLIGNIWSPTVGLVLAYLSVAVLSLAYFIWRHPEWWRPRPLIRTYSETAFWTLMGLAAPLWMTDVLAIISDQADRFLVQGQLGYVVLAEYSAAFTLISLIGQPVAVMSRMYLVTFARGFYTEAAKYRRIVAINLAFIPCIALGVVALAEPLTRILFTAEYTLVPTLVAILSIASVTKSAEVMNTAFTIAQDYPQINRNAKIGTTLIYLPTAFFLVRTYGVMGAAWSYVLSWAAYALIHMGFMRRRLPDHAACAFRLTLAGLALYAVVLAAMRFSSLGLFSVLFAPLYLGLGHALRIWDLDEGIELVHRLIPRRFEPTS